MLETRLLALSVCVAKILLTHIFKNNFYTRLSLKSELCRGAENVSRIGIATLVFLNQETLPVTQKTMYKLRQRLLNLKTSSGFILILHKMQ